MSHRAPEIIVRVPEILTDLRLGMMTDAELATRFREAGARVQQLTRLNGPLATSASGEITQLRVDMLAMQVEIQRRQLPLSVVNAWRTMITPDSGCNR